MFLSITVKVESAGTAIVDANVHIYSDVTDSIDVFKLESPGVNKETGMLIYTGEGEG